jgi:spore germination protein YaaH
MRSLVWLASLVAQMREWMFFTAQRTFEERYRLVENENLQGFCSWMLDEEDPGIWKLMPEHK